MEDGLVTDGESLVGTGDLVLEPESPEFVVPVALSKKESMFFVDLLLFDLLIILL